MKKENDNERKVMISMKQKMKICNNERKAKENSNVNEIISKKK